MTDKCKILSLKETAEYLKGVENAVILTHSSPDGDTLGSGFALKRIIEILGGKAEVVCGDNVAEKFSYLGKTANLEDLDFCGKTIIAVDVADIKLMSGIPMDIRESADLCIDHHQTNKQYAKNLYLDSEASACCEIMHDLCKQLGITPDKDLASAIFTGIVTDTGCFQFTNTTSKTHIAAAELMSCGANSEFIIKLFFETKSPARLYLEKKVLENLELYFDGKCALTTLDFNTIHSENSDESELDGVAGMPRTVEGVLVGVTLKGKEEGKFKISVRTHAPADASAICTRLGGGGHVRAAGCQVTGDAETAKKAILESVAKELNI
ncbi:MAG: bifunctional oligoribonuclease/PAP phosphatase NrnA [Clostridia bacterium]|nr:bifunctional oligoribonuclease/PAP phosphatase NrnA [Clostridia bacterium]